MKRFATLIAAIILCIQYECNGVPVQGTVGKQYVYSYNGTIDTGSSIYNDIVGRWAVKGILTAQNFDNHWIFQLDNLQVSLFNGYREDINNSRFEVIPKDADVLKQPFVSNIETYNMSVIPGEPLWSTNFKRGIIGHFRKLVAGKHPELTVYGNCETNTEFKDDKNVLKTVNHNSCEFNRLRHKSNVHSAPKPEGFHPIQRETSVAIVIDENHPISVLSTSKLTYKPMVKAPYTQEILQYQELHLISSTSEFSRINTEKITKETRVYYEFGSETTQNRHKYETNTKVLINQYLENYKEFEKDFKNVPLENRKNTTNDPVDNMFLALYYMSNSTGIKNLTEEIENKADWEMLSIFLSLIPYVGTSESVKYIYDDLINGDLESTPFYAARLLAIFPDYIDDPSDELLESLEGMLNVENIKIDCVKNGRILSFASVVNRAQEQNLLDDELFEKYQTIYYDKLQSSEKYEYKMMYLLGLINMAQDLSSDFMVSIISNKTFAANLRSLALAGFKTHLIKHSDQLFDTFWTIVQDKEENFDVRVESLDLLLSTKLTEEQFSIIQKKFTNYKSNNVYDLHLNNYFLSTIESLQNNTAYKDPNGDLATAALKNIELPGIREWQTGNYRLSYSDADPNFGGYIHAKLIANPLVNTLSTVQLSSNEFAWSFNTGVYTVYLKVQGVFEYLYQRNFFKSLPLDGTIPDLLLLMKEYNIEMKNFEHDFHVDIVIFADNIAKYAVHINNNNFKEKLREIGDIIDEVNRHIITISYPLVDYTETPSILGTPINIKNDMQDILSFYFRHNELYYRTSWYFQTWLESYDPILDTTISNYKYFGDEKKIHTNISFNPNRLVFAWANKNNSFEWVMDKLMGTTIDNTAMLQKYCPVCEGVAEIPTDLFIGEATISKFDFLGMKYKRNWEQFQDPTEDAFIFNPQNHFHSNAHSLPYAKPVLQFMFLCKNIYNLEPKFSRVSYHTMSLLEEDTQSYLYLDLNIPKINDPFENRSWRFSLNFANSKLNYDPVNSWEILYEFISTLNYTDEKGVEKSKFTEKVYFDNNSFNETRSLVCSQKDEYLPKINSDKFSILPPEDAITLQNIYQDFNVNESTSGECSRNSTISLNGVYTTYEKLNKKLIESDDFKKCKEDSKGLIFTPPTDSCLRTYIAASRYDSYIVQGQLDNIPDMYDIDLKDHPLYSIEKKDENSVNLSLLKSVFTRYNPSLDTNKFWELLSYFPYKIRNPTADVYGEHDVFAGIKRSCIITPTNVKSFTNHKTQITGNKQLAFVECFKSGQRGLTFQKVEPNKIEFKFWSGGNKIESKIVENHMKISHNGNEIKETYINGDATIRIRFVDNNAVMITDDKVIIYYTTEYIYVKVLSMYNDLICGLCSKN